VTVAGFALTFDDVKTYTGTTGGTTYTFKLDDGVLTAVVPEPAAWMLLALAGTFFVVMRRRRN
jgi:hypothetical protein